MKRALLLTGILMLAVFSAAWAQQRKVSGRITDSKGSPIPVATVQVAGTTHGTTADANGNFELTANTGQELKITSIGYLTQTIKVPEGNNPLDIVLKPNTNMLNETVVTAFGIQHQDATLGYSVGHVSGAAIANTNTVNPIAALQGKVAGVMVNVMNSGGVQSSPYIQIRGASVLGGNNQPIFVVDGNILQNNLDNGADNADQGSQLMNLNPNDYASITILKGAAATALYGSRGINGAVVITTKSGQKGKGLGVELTSTYQTSDAYAPFMKLQNEYGMGGLYRDGAFRSDGTQNYTNWSFGPKFDGTMHPVVYGVTGDNQMAPYIARPNNWRTFYHNERYLNNSIALSGATNEFHYRLDYSNTSDNGTLPKNGLNRNALDFKAGGHLNKVFSAEMGVNYANTQWKNQYSQGRYDWPGGQNLGFNIFYLPRNTDLAAWYKTYRNPDNTVKNSSFSYVTNGFSYLDLNNFTQTNNSFLGFLQIKAQVNPWLDFSARGNINNYKQNGVTKNYGGGINHTGGQFAVNQSTSTSYDVLFMGHAVKQFNNFGVDFRILNEYYGNLMGDTSSATTDGGLKVPNEFFLGNSQNALTGSDYSYGYGVPSTLTIGLAGDLNLSYKDYLNLEITGRNDWLSTLTYPVGVPGANNYSVFYPSIDLSYIFTNQFKNAMPSWLTFGKIRASLAYVGNAGVAGAYSTGAGYSPGNIIDNNGNSVPVASQINGNVKPNYNLKPQRQRAIELGTHLGFAGDLVNFDFTWYKTNTFNQLLQLPGVTETGYNTLYINAGNIQNQGIEATLEVKPIQTKNWGLDISVNVGHNVDKIINFYHSNTGNITEWTNSGFYEGTEVDSYEGGKYGVLEVDAGGSRALQLDPKTGYPIITNGVMPTVTNGVFNNGNATNAMPDTFNYAQYSYQYDTAQKVSMGTIQPHFMGGLLVNLRYKNFSLFTQVDGRFGGMVYSEAYTYGLSSGTPYTSLQYRDKAHGGVAITNPYNGQTEYNGVVPDAVFGPGSVGNTSAKAAETSVAGMTFRQAYDQGLVQPMDIVTYYEGIADWENGINWNGAITKESWVMLREISLSYNLPENIVRKTHVLQGASLTLSARNIGYLYNSLPDGQNPASVMSNNPLYPYITGGIPFIRNYAVRLDVKF